MSRITITLQGTDSVLTTGSAAEIARTTGAVIEIRASHPNTDVAVVVKVLGRRLPGPGTGDQAWLAWPQGTGSPEHAIVLSDALAIAVGIVRTANRELAGQPKRTAWDDMPSTGGFSAGRD